MTPTLDALARAKLILHRLNEDWSLTGNTFCHQTASILRRDMTGDAERDILNIQTAVAHMVKRYAAVCDPYEGEYDMRSDAYNLSRWNDIFSAATKLVDDAILLMDTSCQKNIRTETNMLYSKLF
jgi:hypothetical protein